MNHISVLRIRGFKKFKSLDVVFNSHMNILVGENEAGKSTILDAIRIVLNQQYRNADKSVLKDLFNTELVDEFVKNPSTKTLPSITIEAELELDPKNKNAEYFFGEVYGDRKSQPCKYGIRFVCRLDEEDATELAQSIKDGKIPYEYYSLEWTTFANRSYQLVKRPLQLIAIDTTNGSSSSSFNYYNRSLFASKYDEATKAKAKNDFRDKMDEAFDAIKLPMIDSSRKFGIDGKKVILESILSVYEDSVPLENRGSGMESLIKTQIALDKKNGIDVILLEEPENHLCFVTLRKMLEEISQRKDDAQIIVATHNNMIASKLNLNNVLWVTKTRVISLKDVDEKTAEFFTKADDNAFLQLLLSPKVFLVEGATEYLLIPYFFKQLTGKTVEEAGVTVIPCNGIAYKNYLEIAKSTNKRVAVITDNDKKQTRINDAKAFNMNATNQQIFMSDDVALWTWEVCIYNKNKKTLETLIKLKDGAEYLFHGEDYGQVIGKMLNNKVETAYNMLLSGATYVAPQYVKDAIQWLNG